LRDTTLIINLEKEVPKIIANCCHLRIRLTIIIKQFEVDETLESEKLLDISKTICNTLILT